MTEPRKAPFAAHVARARRWLRRELATSRGRIAAGIVGLLIVVVGVAIALSGGSGKSDQALPPTPPSPSAVGPSTPVSQTPTAALKHPSSTAAAPYKCTAGGSGGGGVSAVHLCIPSIKVNADVIPLGLNSDRTVQVPTLAQVRLAGWYKYSPAPGVTGPSIILGHVDSAKYGKGVFFDLGKLHSGEKVTIDRADGMVATYRVDRVKEYPKSAFPTNTIYGDTSTPTLRLITCGGRFDAATGSYVDNIVAFGSLVSLRRA